MRPAWPHRCWLLASLALAAGASASGQVPGNSTPAPASPPAAKVGARLADAAKLRERLGLADYAAVPGARVDLIKVAVLDYGFEGVVAGESRYLPAGTEVMQDYDPDFVRRHNLGDPDYRKPFEPGNRHGRDMAQIIWALTGSRPTGPKFYLLNANGPTMLRRAVRYAAVQGVDLILFSGSFDGGGNGDGRGPIDRIVDEAAGRGIAWINAAGNYGGHVLDAPIRLLNDGYVKLTDGVDVAAARFTNRVDENVVTVTLTWTDYRDREDAGTDKDLDLFIEDPAGRRVGSGAKTQVGARAPASSSPEDDAATSRNPRERVVLEGLPALPATTNDAGSAYKIRVRARSGRFLPSDRVRILVSAARESYVPPGGGAPEEAVKFLDASNRAEVYPPADHSSALTVGDAGPGSSIGPTLDGRVKPDAVVLDSRIDFTDGLITSGSSNAAAEVAGVAVLLKAAEPRLTPHHLFRIARGGPRLDDRADRGRLNLRAWQTPTRTGLAEIVRTR